MLKCSCISDNNFMFTIDYREDNIVYTDYSSWVTAKGNIPQEVYDIIIINEESGLETRVTAKLGLSILIPLSSLRSSENCKSDGIYKFQVESCGVTLERSEAILPSINCAYTQLLVNPNKTEKDWDDIYNVWMQMEMVKASSSTGLTEQASEHFKVLTNIINQLNCNC